jgi:acyl carrier protein
MADVYAQVTGIVAQVLGCDRIDPRADLVDHGATSMTILQIVDLVGQRCGVAVSLTDALDAPDVDSFATVVAERAAGRD